jgi:hypothetical protein
LHDLVSSSVQACFVAWIDAEDFYTFLFLLVPTVTVGALPLFGLVIVLNLLLYSDWLPAMRAQMGEVKWPAFVIAAAPIMAYVTIVWMERHHRGVLPQQFIGTWSLFTGAMFCNAFAACWLLLPDDPDERPARSLNQELRLAMILWMADAMMFFYYG